MTAKTKQKYAIPTYDSKKTIRCYAKDDDNGDILLPNFQRKFVWKLEAQQKLISSLLAGIPIGSVLLMESKKTDMAVRQLCFNKLFIEPKEDKERLYLLDGQQRFSSIKNAFFDICADKKIELQQKKNEIEIEELRNYLPEELRVRWFLSLDDDKFGTKLPDFKPPINLDPNFYFEAISQSANSKYWGDAVEYNEKLTDECVQNKTIPLWKISDADFMCGLLEDIQHRLNKNISKAIRNKWIEEVYNYLKERTIDAIVPNMVIDDTQMNTVIAVFEQVNTSGTKLSILDLLAAKMARHENTPLIDLIKEELDEKRKFFTEKKWTPSDIKSQTFWKGELPTKTFENAFVNCLSLIIHREKGDTLLQDFDIRHIKQEHLVKLDGEMIKKKWKETLTNLLKSYAFLVERCGVVHFSDLKFQLMYLPIFAVMLHISEKHTKNLNKVYDRLEYWYWRSIFEGKYGGQKNEQAARDVRNIINFCFHGKEYDNFDFDDDSLLNKADYSDFDAISLIGKGVNPSLTKPLEQFLLSLKPLDIDNKKKEVKILDEKRVDAWTIVHRTLKIEKDHVLPCGIGKIRNNKKSPYHSALNKTFMRKESNREKSDVTANFGNYFGDYTKGTAKAHLMNTHLLPDNIVDVGIKFDGESRDSDERLEIVEKFMSDRFQKIKGALEKRLSELYSKK